MMYDRLGFYTNVSRYGNTLLYRGYSKNGEPDLRRVKYQPTLYVASKDPNALWRNMHEQPLEPVKCSTMKEAKEFLAAYGDMDTFTIYGNTNYQYAFIQEAFPEKVSVDRRLVNVSTIDIETAIGEGFPDPSTADQEILSIAIHNSRDNTIYVFGMGEYDPKLTELKLDSTIIYRQFPHERALLEAFIEWWSHPYNMPDVLTGWNTRFFDIPYLVNRLIRVLGEGEAKRLSPWKMLNQETVNTFGRPQQTYEIVGINSLDYIELFKKFAYAYGAQESYSLNHIAHVVLEEKKLDYGEAGSLTELHDTNYQRFIDYNIKDVDLVKRFEAKLGLIDIVMTMAYMGGVNFSDTLGTTRIWDTIIYRELCKRNIMVNAKVPRRAKQSFPGGYVKDPQVGMHEWVESVDYDSLYPSVIVQYNMSPETIVPQSKIALNEDYILENRSIPFFDKNLCVAANGAVFRKDKKGIVPEIIENLYAQRVGIKREKLDTEQLIEQQGKLPHLVKKATVAKNNEQAIKILLNSLYGAMGNIYFRHFNLDIAMGITSTGRLAVRWAEHAINKCLSDFIGVEKDRVIAIDTDSCYFKVDEVVNKFQPKNPVAFIDEFSKKIVEPAINKATREMYDMMNCYTERLHMSREVIADRAIWTAKKRYILNVHNSEGVQYKEPKLKMMGIEAIKSSTPEVCRDKMRDLFKIIMEGDEKRTQSAIANFKTSFKKMSPDKIAFPRGVTNVAVYSDPKTVFIKGTPIHSRGALIYNKRVKDLQLDNKYRIINAGDKIKFIYLNKKNITGQNVVSFPDDYLPPELGLHSAIDYELQFQKTFADPIKAILEPIGWTLEPVAKLDAFFG